MTGLRLAKKDWFAFTPETTTGDDIAALADLPRRAGSRPRVAPHPVPHRQLDAHAPAAIVRQLQALFERKVAADPARLCYAMSHDEPLREAS